VQADRAEQASSETPASETANTEPPRLWTDPQELDG
jgi:hypothetical protein